MAKPRRGLKGNPFDVGEKVRLARTGQVGIVLERQVDRATRKAVFDSFWGGPRALTFATYLVRFEEEVDLPFYSSIRRAPCGAFWVQARELRAVPRTEVDVCNAIREGLMGDPWAK
jgi:hypothetical protein